MTKWREELQVGDPERGLIVELRRGDIPHLAISRDDGGLVHIDLDEVKALVAALVEMTARAAADATKDGDILC